MGRQKKGRNDGLRDGPIPDGCRNCWYWWSGESPDPVCHHRKANAEDRRNVGRHCIWHEARRGKNEQAEHPDEWN